jgi:hypothetical protein
MVVIPNDTHVELTYGRTGVEYVSYSLTLLGLVGLVLLWRRPRFRFTPEQRFVPSAPAPWDDDHDADRSPPPDGEAEREAPG